MQCQNCRTKKHSHLKEYGGLMLCDPCYEFNNPPVKRVSVLSDQSRQYILQEKRELEARISVINRRIKEDDIIRASGSKEVSFTTSLRHAFKYK